MQIAQYLSNKYADRFCAEVLSENRMTIEYEVKAALGKQGCVALVTTPKLTTIGHNGDDIVYDADFAIQILENPTVHRAELKAKNVETGTGMDIAIAFGDELYGIAKLGDIEFGHIYVDEITQDTVNGLILSELRFKTTIVERQIDMGWRITEFSSRPEIVGAVLDFSEEEEYPPITRTEWKTSDEDTRLVENFYANTDNASYQLTTNIGGEEYTFNVFNLDGKQTILDFTTQGGPKLARRI